ncbi:hypothetical protein ACFUIW_03695 [Streptomyces sp. NPDC057245]|uniref:hypothetical protein n=1 Tax=Streptomyces sp. NPDC057245 TaxID=3346065 RepID=UPI00362E75B5
MSSELDELRSWVASKARDLPAEGLTDDLPLLEGRHLTSLHIPQLILLLERLRKAPVDVEELNAGDFRDIATIGAKFLGTGPDLGHRRA